MNYKRVAAFIFMLGLIVASIMLFSDEIFSPYVSFTYAQKHPGKYVQILGKRDKDSPAVHDETGFRFSIKDKDGNRLNAFFNGIEPLNFATADQVVVIGRYSAEKNFFEAEKVLTKCPSKYQKEQK